MSDIKQDLKNHRQVATACKSYADTEIASAKTECKNYTDAQIAASEERMKWYISETTPTTSNDNTTAYVKTVPANATRAKIKRIYGLTQKFNPTTAADDTSYMVKTMPETVYDFDVSKVEGASEVSENLIVLNDVEGTTSDNISYKCEKGVITLNGTTTVENNITFLFTTGLPSGTYSCSMFNSDYRSIITIDLITSSNSYIIFLYGYNYATRQEITTNVTAAKIKIKIPAGETLTNVKFTPMLVKGSTLPSEFKVGFDNIHNIELTGIRSESQNILPISDVAETTYNGITYKAVGGKIYAKRTSAYAYNVEIYFARNISLTGSFNLFSNYSNSSMHYRTSENSYTSSVNQTRTNITIDRLSLVFGAEFNQTNYIELTPMFVYGSVAPTTYAPYETPTTKTIDLSTILYNGSPLFEGNSLKGVGTAKDYITPYKAHKEMVSYTFTGNETITKTSTVIGGGYRFNVELPFVIRTDSAILSNRLEYQTPAQMYSTNRANYGIAARETTEMNTVYIYVVDIENGTPTDMKNWLINNPTTIVIQLATPIEVSIDWSSTLRGIQGYSNGTITLQNTYNMDTANTITYNSIIKEVLNTGVRLDGANLCSNGVNLNSNWDYFMTFYAKPNTTYFAKVFNINASVSDSLVTLCSTENQNNIETYYSSSYSHYLGTGFTFTTGNITEGIYRLRFVKNTATEITGNPMINEGSTALSYRPYKSPVTVNFPTQASDAYSAGSVSNVRDFTTWKRSNNVNKESNLSTLDYNYQSANTRFISSTINGLKVYTDKLVIPNLLCKYNTVGAQDFDSNVPDKAIRVSNSLDNTNVMIRDTLYDNATIFKTAMANKPLYYELADASKTETDITVFNNILEVEEGDTLTFLNSENMAVPSDITYRIEVAN